jgi:O-antigen ligase
MMVMTVRRKLKIVGSIAMVGALGVILVAGKSIAGREISLESGADRLALWSDALGIIKTKPLWGLGYKGYSDEFKMTAHNSILLVGTETGLLGLALWLGLFVISFRQLSRIINPPVGTMPDPVAQRHAKCLEIALGGFLTTAWFLSRAYQPTPYILMGLVAGLVYEESQRTGSTALHVRWKEWVPMSFYCTLGAISLIYLLVRLRAI